MKISKLAIGLAFSATLISSIAVAKEPVKSTTAEPTKSTLSGASTKPKNLDWELRNR